MVPIKGTGCIFYFFPDCGLFLSDQPKTLIIDRPLYMLHSWGWNEQISSFKRKLNDARVGGRTTMVARACYDFEGLFVVRRDGFL